jgi:hypothetical protein
MSRVIPAVETSLNDIGRAWDIQRQQDTSDWSTKPAFTHDVVSENNTTELRLRTNDNRWAWIDKGTGRFGDRGEPYVIAPLGDYPLRFQTGYSAKTAPVARSGVGSGQANGAFVSTNVVIHPGIRNRDFTKDYADRNRSAHREQIRDAIRGALKGR